MSIRALIAIFVLALVVALMAFLPARLVFDQLARPAGVSAGLVHGTVWQANIIRARAGRVQVRDVKSWLNPISLVSGVARFDVTLTDPNLRGQGQLAVGFGDVTLTDASAVIGLDSIPAIGLAGLARGQSAQLDIETLRVSHEGRCLDAAGQIRTAILLETGVRYGVELPMLSAQLVCAGEDIALNVSGENDQLGLEGLVRVLPDGLDWRFQAQTTNRDVMTALSLLGFDQDGPYYIASSDQGSGG